jgi:hypothetical protein
MWALNPLISIDFFDMVLPSNEDNLEAMTSLKSPWGYMHNQSYFLLELDQMDIVGNKDPISSRDIDLVIKSHPCT